MTDPLFILAVILTSVALAHWLSNTRMGRPLGGAIIVIVLVAILANIGVVPTASSAPPLYAQLISVGAPLSIFWLLLDVRLTALRKAGLPMLLLFLLGTLATMSGVLLAGWLTGAGEWLGDWYGPLSGMFTATYTGGGANFNALALHYEFFATGNLFAAATVVDHVVTVVWIAALLLMPKLIYRWLPSASAGSSDAHRLAIEGSDKTSSADSPEQSTIPPEQRPGMLDLAVLLALGFIAHWASLQLAAVLATLGVAVPSILILTVLALLLAQVPLTRRLQGTQVLGMYGAYVFLAVLGAYCELTALIELGQIGLLLLLFVGLAVLIHGVLMFSIGLACKQSPEAIAVASTANVGGATVVLPMVQSFRRMDLLLPGILVGSLGNALGTFVGFFVVRLLG